MDATELSAKERRLMSREWSATPSQRGKMCVWVDGVGLGHSPSQIKLTFPL